MKCPECGQYHEESMDGEAKARHHVGMKLDRHNKKEAAERERPYNPMKPKKGKK